MAKAPPYYPEKIRKQFRDEYVGTQGIYMTGLTHGDKTLVAFVMEEDVPNLTLPEEYEGFPVIHVVQPNGWGRT